MLLGNGDGSFQPRRVYATGAFPYGIVAGDFNNDGIVDLAAANEGSGDVSIFLGNGNGTFQQQVRTPAGAGAQTIAAGDLNGDPYPDLVVANRNINSVSVLINAADWSIDPINGPSISSTLPPCDDCSSPPVPLGFSFDFFGVRRNTVWINNNGNLTFDGPFASFVPGPIAGANQPILAPFWADVYTNGNGLGEVHYGPGTQDGDPAFFATWVDVAPFLPNGQFNYFQVVIVDHTARLGYYEI